MKKICLERAQDYTKRVRLDFEKWCSFGYPNSDPTIERDSNPATDKQVNLALPRVYRCTECGKFRLINFELLNGKEIIPELFICMENPDTVSSLFYRT